MYNYDITGPRYINEDERAAFKKALIVYYSVGCSIKEAFKQVERGLIDRYYRRKKKYPDEIEQKTGQGGV